MTVRLVPVVLIAAGLLAAGCGSQQGSPLSVAKTKSAFASAGIPVGPDRYWLVTLQTNGKADHGRAPVAPIALLTRVLNGGSVPSTLSVTVFPTAADALRKGLHYLRKTNDTLFHPDTIRVSSRRPSL